MAKKTAKKKASRKPINKGNTPRKQAATALNPLEEIKRIQEEAKHKVLALVEGLQDDEVEAINTLRDIQKAILDAGGKPRAYTVPGSLPSASPRKAPATAGGGGKRRRRSGGGMRVAVLKYLSEHESATADDICGGIGDANKNTVSVTLSTLAKEGLIEKPARGLNSITAAGQKELAAAG